MSTRRNWSAEAPPDLPQEKAHSLLKAQLTKLGELKGLNYLEAQAQEEEWYALTAKLVMRSFGSESPNYQNFRKGRSAGEYVMLPKGAGVPHELNQRNFEARQQAFGSALRSCISVLEVACPKKLLRGPTSREKSTSFIGICVRA